ncbi:YeiH family protein [uncultured Cellulomonas sp.]|uniref:YeiH family protein n=1 Tax=uncultured Cellulomonas sp. TaxID=189682 RepID=UPI00261D4C17|nr:putative sulfate exporter family transporter [uncultured Cellulomonas sp.]
MLAVAIACLLAASRVPAVSALLLAIAVGVLARNLHVVPAVLEPGLAWSSRPLLRTGVVLLGLQLAVADVLRLGLGELAVLLVTVAATFAVTVLVGRRMGVRRPVRLLVATGFAICGAAAVAAMAPVADADDEDVATAIALVTLYGSATIVLVPVLAGLLGLADRTAGLWAGLAVHEVAQVVAAAGAVSGVALAAAVVAKLARVVLLAPLVAGVSVAVRRGTAPVAGRRRPPLLPLFVVGFLVAVAVRSTGLLPDRVLTHASVLTTVLLAAAMVGLGAQVDLRRLVRTGGRALGLGAVSTVTALAVSLGGLLLVG